MDIELEEAFESSPGFRRDVGRLFEERRQLMAGFCGVFAHLAGIARDGEHHLTVREVVRKRQDPLHFLKKPNLEW